MAIKWQDLQIGQHVKVSCGCAGFVYNVVLEGRDESCIGFGLMYTSENCGGKRQSRWGHRNAYSDGYGPYRNFFNYDPASFEPIVEVPAPSWYKSMEAGPDRKLQTLKREHRRRQIEAAEEKAHGNPGT